MGNMLRADEREELLLMGIDPDTPTAERDEFLAVYNDTFKGAAARLDDACRQLGREAEPIREQLLTLQNWMGRKRDEFVERWLRDPR